MRHSWCLRAILAPLFLLVSFSLYGESDAYQKRTAEESTAEEKESTAEKSSAERPSSPDQENNDPWYDDSHKYVVHHADNIAQWMDDFFGDARTEEEASYSTLRLRLEEEWMESEGLDTGVRLRGKLYLPRISRRLSLLFSDEDDAVSREDDLLTDDQDKPDDIALQYMAREKEFYRIDFKVGLRSSGDPKGSVRYRYERPLYETLIGRFSEEAIYRGGEGLGSRTRLELDKILTDDRVLKWRNRVDWTEAESGISWNTLVSMDRRLSKKQAISYYVSARGKTQPYGLTTSYGLGIRYRQNIFRPWLFAEFQPNYRWLKEDTSSGREGTFGILARLEIVFEKDFGKPAD